MKIQVNDKNSELVSIFTKHLSWHKARITFLTKTVLSMIKLQPVNFVKLSQGFESNAQVQSNLRIIQRFFSEFVINEDIIAKLLFAMLPDNVPPRLCLDSTNWKFGKTDINILMLSVAYRGVSFPLIWKLLPKRGNSNHLKRTKIMTRCQVSQGFLVTPRFF